MNAWLNNFAFKTDVGPGLFLVAGVVNLLLALLILAYHSLRIAETNPVDTLRYE
jgi:putative ABC transport system permease protein